MSISTRASANVDRNWTHLFIDSAGRVVGFGQPNPNGRGTDPLTTPLIERYDPTTNTWTNLGGTAPQEHINGAVGHDSSDRLYMSMGQVTAISGVSANFASTDRTYMYDPTSNSWSEVTRCGQITEWSTSFHQARRFVWYTFNPSTGAIWLLGGQEQTGDQDVTELNFLGASQYHHTNTIRYTGGASGTWSQVAQHPAGAGWVENLNLINSSGDPSAFSPNSPYKMYVMGTSSGLNVFPQVFDPSTNTWSQIAAAPASGSAYAFDSTDRLYLVAASSLVRYDPSSNTWSTLAAAPWAGSLIHFGANAYFGESLYLFRNTTTNTSIARYDLATNAWSTLTEVLSAGRSAPYLVADANGIYVIGGNLGAFSPVSQVVDYLQPGAPAAPVGKARGFAAVIGD